MSDAEFYKSIFNIIEYLVETELTDQGKHLVANYMESSKAPTMAGKARYAIKRYTQTDVPLPTLADLKARGDVSQLDLLDHLILKMEYESTQL